MHTPSYMPPGRAPHAQHSYTLPLLNHSHLLTGTDSLAMLIQLALTRSPRYVLGVTDEERQQRREQILGTTVKDFR